MTETTEKTKTSEDLIAALPADSALRSMTMGELVQELMTIRNEKREHNKRLEELEEDWRVAEALLMMKLDAEGMNRAASDIGIATITTDDVPLVQDWDAAHKYMLENDALHFLQRRIAVSAWKELRAAGFELPGVEVYTKRSISLRKDR